MRHAVKVPSTARLIAVPALISIGVTALRLVGELLHWAKPLVNSDVCGKAILGVVWLVPIFGIYFAVKLFHADNAPQRFAGPMVLAISALALKLAGTFVMESQGMRYAPRLSMNFIVTLTGLVLSAMAWPTLFKALLAYGYLSRIPIAIVQYLAMRGRWGTHYDALDPGFPSIGFWPTFLRVSFVPNIFFMEAYAVIVGVLVGIAAIAVLGPGQTGSVGDSSLGNHIRGQGHDLADVESAVNDEPSRRLYSACDNSGVLKDPCHRRTSERVLASPGGGRWRRVGCAYALGFDGGDSQVRGARAEQGGSGTGSTSHSDQLR